MRDELTAKREQLHGIFEEARDGESYDYERVRSIVGGPEAVRDEVKRRTKEIDELARKLDDAVEAARVAEDNRRALEDDRRPFAPPPHPAAPGDIRAVQPKSLGRLFVESDAYKGMVGMNGPASVIDIGAREFKTLFQTSIGWSPEALREGRVELKPERPVTVVNFIPTSPTNQNSVKYMEETTFNNAAVEKAEAAAYPEAALALTEKSQSVQKIAVFLPVTDEQLEDEEQAEGYVNDRLAFMLQQRLDLQVLRGDGSAPNLLGTNNVTGIQTQAKGTDPTPDAFYKLFRKIRSDGFAEPSVVFVHPNDWESIRLLRTADGVYIWGSPSEPGPERIWGVRVIQTTAAAQNTATAGDYATYSALRVKRGVEMRVSDSHSTYFVEGKQAIRADLRAAVVHYRPKAFGTVTGI